MEKTQWNKNSGVYACEECGGTGRVRAFRRPTIDDPYPEKGCDCGLGEHTPECPVCGYTHHIKGYDCLACDTVASLPNAALKDFDVAGFMKAFEVAIGKAKIS